MCEYCADLGKYKAIACYLCEQTAPDEFYEAGFDTRFCPNCGRQLVNPTALTFKDIRGKEPFLLDYPLGEVKRWVFLKRILHEDEIFDDAHYVFIGRNGEYCLCWTDYGKTWQVLRHSPREDV